MICSFCDKNELQWKEFPLLSILLSWWSDYLLFCRKEYPLLVTIMHLVLRFFSVNLFSYLGLFSLVKILWLQEQKMYSLQQRQIAWIYRDFLQNAPEQRVDIHAWIWYLLCEGLGMCGVLYDLSPYQALIVWYGCHVLQ